ncbi:MAG TPA: dTDP-4-dehydrorhamnose 3,5-epimerase [Caulobacteraceae bacterium]|nr:dTDP-4-dehydrorhamnose 3,5-epimerase [Caulobacteraceae bacterium]
MTPKLIHPRRISDARGWFAEVFSARRYAELGIDVAFVQDNHSHSAAAGVVRGLHFQVPPHAQAKLVRCLAGRMFDVAVDIRAGSPTFGRWVAHELSAENGLQLFVPAGFAHGFMTLEPGTEVDYKVSDFYAPACERGVLWNDPALGIPWPSPQVGAPALSARDAALPCLAELASPFVYDGAPLEPLTPVPG